MLLLAGLGTTAWLHDDDRVANAATGADTVVNTPRVVMLSGIPGSTTTDVVTAGAGSGDTPAVLATIEHLPEAVVRGALLPDGTVVVVADTVPMRERSWAASLLRVEPGRPPRALVDRVYHASRPLVTGVGRLFVQRGKLGSTPTSSSALRVDDLTVEEVDPSSGSTREIMSWQGYETHLAGSLDREILVYRVGPKGADLVATDMDTGQVRVVIPSWPGMARDFSVDEQGRELVVQQLDEGPPRRWVVERVALDTGHRRVLASSEHRDLVPYAWPGGGTLVNPEDRRGPKLLSTGGRVDKPDGAGVLWLRGASPDRAWLFGSWSLPGQLPEGVVVRVADGKVVRIPRVEGHRVDVLGLQGGGR